MPTLNVVLTDHQENVIEALVESGRYRNASEVLRDGLQLIEMRESASAKSLDLRAAVKAGDDAFDRGEYKTFPNADEAVAYLTTIGDAVLRNRSPR